MALSPKEFSILLHAVDQMIHDSEPRTAEYYRGYRLGIQFRQLGPKEERRKNNLLSAGSTADTGNHYVDAFSRGYRDGCNGLKPSPRVTVPE